MEEKHETLTLHLAGCSPVPSVLKPSKNVKCSIVFGEVKKMCFNSDPHVARNVNNTPLKALCQCSIETKLIDVLWSVIPFVRKQLIRKE